MLILCSLIIKIGYTKYIHVHKKYLQKYAMSYVLYTLTCMVQGTVLFMWIYAVLIL